MTRFTMILFILATCSACIIGTSACGPNSVFHECASACPTTCENMHSTNPKLCPAVCVPRCKCIGNTVLNKEGRCVSPHEC